METLLIIDDIFLQNRLDSMQIKYYCISQLDTNRFNDELKYDFVTFHGLIKTYNEIIPQYRSLVYDNQVFLKLTNELRKSFFEKKVNKVNNDKELQQLQTDVSEHVKSVKDVVRNIINLENVYSRLSPKITNFYKTRCSK